MKSLFSFCLLVLVLSVNAQDTTVYDMNQYVDNKPRWKGCDSIVDETKADDCWMKKYIEFLNKNLTYPSTCAHFSGKLFIEFIVELDGSVKLVKILKGGTDNINKEVARVLKLLPHFSPAKIKGVAVRYRYRMPITICFQ